MTFTTEKIYELLDEHKKLIDTIAYDSEKLQRLNQIKHETENNSNFLKIHRQHFEEFESTYSIKLPASVKYFYSEIGCSADDRFFCNFSRREKSFNFLYTKEFAISIIDIFQKFQLDDEDFLKKGLNESTLENYNTSEKLLNFYLTEAIEGYNLQTNSFNLPFLQYCYEKGNLSQDLIHIILETWSHCGGYGGLVLNNTFKEYEGGNMWDTYVNLEYENKSYEFCTFNYVPYNHFLQNKIELILDELRQLHGIFDNNRILSTGVILAFDTYYYNSFALTVCIGFENWSDKTPKFKFESINREIEEYESGAFYKRELPCILKLLEAKKHNLQYIKAIIVDGYVFLDDNETLGLGGHLYQSLKNNIPVIGVAKTNFAQINKLKIEILRGKSSKPLYITAIGTDLVKASELIKSMHGEYRVPTLLKEVDTLTKSSRHIQRFVNKAQSSKSISITTQNEQIEEIRDGKIKPWWMFW